MGRRTHGLSRDPMYIRWRMMIARCHQPTAQAFASYGGRGITVCDRWRESFAAFVADMGPQPTPKHEIDRIDNDAGYSPENCRWATRSENDRNRRSTVWVEYRGERRKLADLRDINGISPDTMTARLASGWSVEDAVETPLQRDAPNASVFVERAKSRRRPDQRGSRSANARLTEADVVAIRTRNANGETKAALAREFSVSEGNIWNIVTRLSWGHVP